jgi:PAS domain S-box-containing protein
MRVLSALDESCRSWLFPLECWWRQPSGSRVVVKSKAFNNVSAAEISRSFGLWQDKALKAPVTVTHHGRPRVVILSADRYAELVDGSPSAAKGDSEAKAQLNVVIEQLLHAFVALDAELRYTIVNPAAQAYYGLSREEMLGRPMTSVFPEFAGSALASHYEGVLRSGEVATFETPSPRIPNRRFLVRVFPFGDGIASVFTNISELHGLRQQVATLRSVATALAIEPRAAHVGLNTRGSIVESGADFEGLSGFSRDELAGKHLVDVFQPVERSGLTDAIGRVLSDRAVVRMDGSLLHKDQSVRPVSLAMAPIALDLAPDGIAAIITERAAP